MTQPLAVGGTPTPEELTSASSTHDHLVEFYDSHAFLVDSVARFLAPALAGGEAAVVVATPEHVAPIREALEVEHDPSAVVFLDASELLDDFMVDGAPDPDRFLSCVGAAVDQATRGRRGARVFGEMVAVLWEQGNVSAAIALEDLWNTLLESRRFTLLCAYPTTAFERDEHSWAIRHVCAQHQAVLPSAKYGDLADPQRAVEFASMVAHDIRNPTVVVSALLSFLRGAWEELDGDEITECLDKALNSIRQIERLSQDMLTLGQLESGEFSYDLRPIDLRAVVQTVVNQTRSTTGRVIELSVDPDLDTALADQDRQIQVLSNLLSNAVKFSSELSTVSVTVTCGRGELRVSVRDEGPGIPADDLDGLFLPFSRLGGGGDANRRAAGTGLGLYIAKALVEGQGGTIDVDSVEGEGSTFTYTVLSAGQPRSV